ncbi:MAG: PilT/PilU family type 4a pilus ATPase [Candidatus Tritonobacter lacicola]|nr:PilT/PilU family type 4a pilus ATPase [Candidatus Tritonobacter lacicola]
MEKLVTLLRKMVDVDASDLHLKAGARPVVRVRTELIDLPFDRLTPASIEEMAHFIMSDSTRTNFKHRGEVDFAYEQDDLGRFRVNVFMQRGRCGVVMRFVKKDIPTFAELNLPGVLKNIVSLPSGIAVVSGATGCGKSTTLAAMVGYINSNFRRHIVTIEDPIEYLHEDDKSIIDQREVGIDTHSFANALRVVLRQDPDIIMIGEVRDADSLRAAIVAAETGHLVLTTLHTSTAVQAVSRVLDFFSVKERDQVRIQLSLCLRAVICQKLLPRVDMEGLIPAVEIMIASGTVRKLIRENLISKLFGAIQTGGDEGMQTINQHLVDLVRNGRVSEEVALAAAPQPEVLKMNLQGIFLDEDKRILDTD